MPGTTSKSSPIDTMRRAARKPRRRASKTGVHRGPGLLRSGCVAAMLHLGAAESSSALVTTMQETLSSPTSSAAARAGRAMRQASAGASSPGGRQAFAGAGQVLGGRPIRAVSDTVRHTRSASRVMDVAAPALAVTVAASEVAGDLEQGNVRDAIVTGATHLAGYHIAASAASQCAAAAAPLGPAASAVAAVGCAVAASAATHSAGEAVKSALRKPNTAGGGSQNPELTSMEHNSAVEAAPTTSSGGGGTEGEASVDEPAFWAAPEYEFPHYATQAAQVALEGQNAVGALPWFYLDQGDVEAPPQAWSPVEFMQTPRVEGGEEEMLFPSELLTPRTSSLIDHAWTTGGGGGGGGGEEPLSDGLYGLHLASHKSRTDTDALLEQAHHTTFAGDENRTSPSSRHSVTSPRSTIGGGFVNTARTTTAAAAVEDAPNATTRTVLRTMDRYLGQNERNQQQQSRERLNSLVEPAEEDEAAQKARLFDEDVARMQAAMDARREAEEAAAAAAAQEEPQPDYWEGRTVSSSHNHNHNHHHNSAGGSDGSEEEGAGEEMEEQVPHREDHHGNDELMRHARATSAYLRSPTDFDTRPTDLVRLRQKQAAEHRRQLQQLRNDYFPHMATTAAPAGAAPAVVASNKRRRGKPSLKARLNEEVDDSSEFDMESDDSDYHPTQRGGAASKRANTRKRKKSSPPSSSSSSAATAAKAKSKRNRSIRKSRWQKDKAAANLLRAAVWEIRFLKDFAPHSGGANMTETARRYSIPIRTLRRYRDISTGKDLADEDDIGNKGVMFAGELPPPPRAVRDHRTNFHADVYEEDLEEEGQQVQQQQQQGNGSGSGTVGGGSVQTAA